MPTHHIDIPPAAIAIVRNAAVVKSGEKVVVVADKKSLDIAQHILAAAAEAANIAELVEIPLARGHGEEPPVEKANAILAADVVLACTTFSMSHTSLRVEVCARGGRFLSMADYDMEMLHGGGTMADYVSMAPTVEKIAGYFEAGRDIRLTTTAGTDIRFVAEGRGAMAAPAYCPNPGDFGSPPDIEANFAPVEERTEGVLVVDGSIPAPGLGLIEIPIRVEVQQGRVVDIQGGREAEVLRKLWDDYNDPSVLVAAELGVGLNPTARLCGRMLEDEGVMGTAHVGFGSNITIGGNNVAPVHIDLVCKSATVSVDKNFILKDGQLVTE